MITQSSNNWSSYKRKAVNISKAIQNDEVSQLLNIHYKYLYTLLVKSEQDRDTFNDTYLRLTYKYNPEQDFIEQFKYYFKLLKGAFYRDDKVANYNLSIDSAVVLSIPDKTEPELSDQPQKSLTELKNSIQSYANFKKSKTRATAQDKQG